MLPIPGPEEQRQIERVRAARAGLGMVTVRKVPEGLALLRAHRNGQVVLAPASPPRSTPPTTAQVVVLEPPVDAVLRKYRSGKIGGRNVLRHLLRAVADKHGITVAEIMSGERWKHIVLARHEFCYLARVEIGRSLPAIGRFIHRDHSTVLHAVRAHQERMEAGE